jgi:iron complex outermembrane recepter protein
MKRLFFFFCGFILPGLLFAQKADSLHKHFNNDSLLQEVTVQAFQLRLQWKTVPAAVAVISFKEINRYSNVSLVPVLNTVPGVRMEERSPSSFRLSLRGSLLRSPFGVRNVKVYWNDIPLTDGGGNTYINLVEMSQLSGAEIIKGPAASTYGAGTGGAVLLRSDLNFSDSAQHHYNTGLSTGSFGLFGEQAGWEYRSKNFTGSLQQSHQQADGYRNQSASRKDVVKWQAAWQFQKQQLDFLVFYTDIYYQTPGGITLSQMQQDPKLSRQPAGTIPGSAQQQASIYNKTFFGSVHHEVILNDRFVLKSFFVGNHTSFTNPFITNYETRGETNFGAGTSLVYQAQKNNNRFQWINGLEWLTNHSLINDYGNKGGVPDTVQFKDDIHATQWFAFSQAQFSLQGKWVFTAGLSLNNQLFKYKRLTDVNSSFANKNIDGVLAPRIAVLYRLNRNLSLYMLAAKGFSPPTVAEVRPSDGNYYGNLNAEYGWNYETGIKGELFSQRLQFDVAAYFFNLKNAIVRRTNIAGSEYFVNAGGTKQNGIEALMKYDLVKKTKGFITGCNVWSSYSFQPYTFEDYQQATVNYAGNAVTGVPRNIWVSGVDLTINKNSYCNISVNATSSLPLTDANDVYAAGYTLVQVKWGYYISEPQARWHVFAGIDNLFDQLYSLGNDINALGKRYYNPAARRNVFGGIQYRF